MGPPWRSPRACPRPLLLYLEASWDGTRAQGQDTGGGPQQGPPVVEDPRGSLSVELVSAASRKRNSQGFHTHSLWAALLRARCKLGSNQSRRCNLQGGLVAGHRSTPRGPRPRPQSPGLGDVLFSSGAIVTCSSPDSTVRCYHLVLTPRHAWTPGAWRSSTVRSPPR